MTFDLDLRVNVDEVVLADALTAAALVLRRHLGRLPVALRVVVGESIRIEGRSDARVNAHYDHHTRTISFAWRTMLGRLDPDAHPVQAIRVAAHEAMHAVQCARADATGAAYPENALAVGVAYDADPAEVEANQESYRVLAGRYPGPSVHFPGGVAGYVMPERSDYEPDWRAAFAGPPVYTRRDVGGPAAGSATALPDSLAQRQEG